MTAALCKPLLVACISTAVMSMVCGCSSFESRWRDAGANAPAAPRGLEGRWQGTWVSDGDGHTGGLRCIITHEESDAYLADFHATFWKIFNFGYSIDLKVTPITAARYQFTGDSDLGWLAGGNYHYDGTAEVGGTGLTDSFTCTYKSAADHGRFNMTRLLPAAVAPPSP